MPIEISWLVEGRIVYVKLDGKLTFEKIHAISKAIVTHLDAGQPPYVHVLIDNQDMTSHPQTLNKLREATRFLKHPNLGWFIIFGSDNPLLRFFSSVITQLAGVRWRVLGTRTEALSFLQEVDQTLPDFEVTA